MKVLAFDIEGDGLLPTVSRVWCGATTDINTGETIGYGPDELPQFVEALRAADRLVGHNAVSYDRPALEKVLGVKDLPPIIDTMLLSMLVYPDRSSNPIKSHSLKAWGEALKCHKGEHNDWSQFTPEMLEYCKQDTVVTARIFDYLTGFLQGQHEAIRLEHQFAAIIQKQVANGFCLDKDAVSRLRERLHKDRAEAMAGLMHIPPWKEEVTLKSRFWRDPETGSLYETKAGAPKEVQKRLLRDGPQITRVKEIPFNPGSGDHKARLFMEKYGWKPKKLTETGKPAVDADVLKDLPYPEAKTLTRISLIDKRLSTYVDAWEKYERNGRVHGEVITIGASTHRCAHHSPNMNVPKVGKPYGEEMRACFVARPGWDLIGCDAQGLQERGLAHYMAQWDGGAYCRAMETGRKEDGTDSHSLWAKALGYDPKKEYTFGATTGNAREQAKTHKYCTMFGGQAARQASILGITKDQMVRKQAEMARMLPGLPKITEWVQTQAKQNGYIVGLDGRRVPVSKPHTALAGLLQCFEKVVMAKALVIFHEDAERIVGPHGGLWAQVVMVHDEWEVESSPSVSDILIQIAKDAIRKSGEYYKLNVRLEGSARKGRSWLDVH